MSLLSARNNTLVLVQRLEGKHLGSDEGGGHVLHFQDSQAGQLLVDALEDMVVQVPGLVQLRLLAAVPILVAPLVCLSQLPAVGLQEDTRALDTALR